VTDQLATADELIAATNQEQFTESETGLGRRFAAQLGPIVRYDVDRGVFLLWNGKILEPDTKENLKTFALTMKVIDQIRVEALELSDEEGPNGGRSPRQRALEYAIGLEALASRRKIMEMGKEHAALHVVEEQLDAVGTDLVTPSGVVNLLTGEQRPAKASDLNTRMCTVPYEPDAKSKELDLFLKTFLPDEDDQRFVFALLGRCLIAGNHTRTFPIILGGTTSGKSQLMAAVHKIMGPYACAIGASVFRGNMDDKPRPDLVKAMYTRLAWASEASKGWQLHADQIKRLTGGDPLPYRDHYEGVVNAMPRFTPLLITNEMPKIAGADGAIRRRIIVVTFDRSLAPGQEDPQVKQRFLNDSQCLKAILARMVAGARDHIMANVDHIPQKYILATMNATGALSNVEEFLMWMYEEGRLVDVDLANTPVSHCVKASAFHTEYVEWIKNHGDAQAKKEQLDMTDFGKQLRDRGWQSKVSGGVRWIGRKLNTGVPSWPAGGAL
jgi:P4 family phage/plasmid primase-like protien